MYAPINNILVVKGKCQEDTINEIKTELSKFAVEPITELRPISSKKNVVLHEVWLFFTTNSTPCEKEIESAIKDSHKQLKFYFSSTDYDGFEWNYYKRLGGSKEHHYKSNDTLKMFKELVRFVRKSAQGVAHAK